MGRQRKQSTRNQRRQEERQIAKQERKMATPPAEFNSLTTIKDEPDEDDNPEPADNRVFYTEAMLKKIGEASLTANDLKALLFIRSSDSNASKTVTGLKDKDTATPYKTPITK